MGSKKFQKLVNLNNMHLNNTTEDKRLIIEKEIKQKAESERKGFLYSQTKPTIRLGHLFFAEISYTEKVFQMQSPKLKLIHKTTTRLGEKADFDVKKERMSGKKKG